MLSDIKGFADILFKLLAFALLNYCKEYGDVVEAIYYSGENDDVKQRSFLNKLAYIDYSLETKPVKTIRDYETGETSQKANLDIEIVLDMFNVIDRSIIVVPNNNLKYVTDSKVTFMNAFAIADMHICP